MLYIMLAYLMLLAALFSAVCLYNVYFSPLTFENAFCFHALSRVFDTLLVYLKYYFASCTVLLICWFSNFFLSTPLFLMRGQCAL